MLRQARYAGNHPEVANSLNNVGRTYQGLGQIEKALDYYK